MTKRIYHKNKKKGSSTGTHLGLLDSALLEGTCARVVGTVVPVFTPVALVRTTHT